MIFSACVKCDEVVPSALLLPSPYQRWAHEHWVWNHNSKSDQVDVLQLIEDYAAHDIKVGGVNIDSTWETAFNNFHVDEDKFPDFESMVKTIHDKHDIRLILWATSFVNEDNPDYQYAVDEKYLVRDIFGKVKPLKWWHGKGGLLDYTNPNAVKWWHSLMDNVLKLSNGDGVDGFKCDASDPYIIEYMLAGGALGYNDIKYESYHQYADLYYGDFFNYTREIRGDAGLIMSRPVDCLADTIKGKATDWVCLAQSPQFVMTSGWVGDDDSTFEGLRSCGNKVIYSAWNSYANYGCDIGGYRFKNGDDSDEAKKEYFLRSAQFNSFLPLMENGGAGEHRPWLIVPGDDSITDIYREFVNQHTRLSMHLLTIGSNAIDSKTSVITPMALENDKPKHEPIRDERRYPIPSTYSYLLGDNILVHPVLHGNTENDNNNNNNSTLTTSVEMVFPAGHWLDWWQPANSKLAYMNDKETFTEIRQVNINEYPVYVKKNSLLPLLEDDSQLTFTWFSPCTMEKDHAVSAQVREPASDGKGYIATAQITGDKNIDMSISAHTGNVAISLIDVPDAQEINFKPNTAKCTTSDYNTERKQVLVQCEDNSNGIIINFSFKENL
jgi:alpha-glucosidase (family GH31 glycosyl hydrolase)